MEAREDRTVHRRIDFTLQRRKLELQSHPTRSVRHRSGNPLCIAMTLRWCWFGVFQPIHTYLLCAIHDCLRHIHQTVRVSLSFVEEGSGRRLCVSCGTAGVVCRMFENSLVRVCVPLAEQLRRAQNNCAEPPYSVGRLPSCSS